VSEASKKADGWTFFSRFMAYMGSQNPTPKRCGTKVFLGEHLFGHIQKEIF
jgi:hypothetical protein